jgi:pimeloyl-ACP methyl ester carboxylesterase
VDRVWTGGLTLAVAFSGATGLENGKLMKIGRIALAGLTSISLAVLVGPFLVPVPPLRGTHPAQALADADSQFIEFNGLSVHLKTLGQEEPPFVLMHGFGARLYSWQAVTEPLSLLGQVIAYDRPGLGLPAAAPGRPRCPVPKPGGVLIALLNHFGKPGNLVGNSAGGALAMQVALAYRSR